MRAIAALAVLALLATACGGDDGGAGPTDSPIDEVLGMQAVQDFTIHFGMWTLDGDRLVDLYDPLLDRAEAGAGDRVDLAAGFTFAPVDGLEARMVDEEGRELPSLSVDFGLLAPTAEAVEETRSVFATQVPAGDDELAAAIGGPAVAEPFLVEIVTADYSTTRTHVGFGDRSEIDLTFIEALRPGADVAVLTLFGQTLPGDPAAEQGLDPRELFTHRWNQGLVRVVGDGGPPQPLLDSDIDVVEGSTILSREQKRQLGLIAANAAAREANDAVVASIRAAQADARAAAAEAGDGGVGRGVLVGPGFTVEVTNERLGPVAGRSSYTVAGQGASYTTDNQWKAWAYARTLLALEVCSRVATALVARNEAASPPGIRLDRFPSLRPSDGASSGPFVGPTLPEEPESEGQPRLSCGDPPDPDAPPPSGGTHGDVRFLTIDGVVYAQQAVGEFLVFENGSTVVQMRAEPAGESQGASIATAFAVGTGGQSIAMHRGGRIFVDGELRELERGERIRLGEAEVLRGSLDGWTIAWPDGQLVKVFDRGEVNGMTLTVQPPLGAGDAIGQLGDGDGDPDNDFRTRDGEQLDRSVVEHLSEPSDRDEFYGTYVDSWRLTRDESLLHYDEGESTETFLIEGFPSTSISVDDLDSEARAEAEEVCRSASVVDDRFFDGCVVDVVVTGDPGYAYDAFRVQVLAIPPEEPPSPSDPERGATGAPSAGPSEAVLTIGDETTVFGEDPPDQRDGGVAPSWDCEITDGNLFADGRIDPADGPRDAISVQYLAAEPRFTLTVRRTTDGRTGDHAWVLTNVAHFADAVDDVTLDGSRLTATGRIYVNDPPELGLAPFSQLPPGATLEPFSLDIDCGS